MSLTQPHVVLHTHKLSSDFTALNIYNGVNSPLSPPLPPSPLSLSLRVCLLGVLTLIISWGSLGLELAAAATASDFCVSPDTYITRVTKENAVINQGRGTREGQRWMEGVGEMWEQKEGRGEAGAGKEGTDR
uniref:Protein tweety homolog n=1 Tax=Hucho hucho TaxID=62062 RepID=A0A4W5KDL2_9TELE